MRTATRHNLNARKRRGLKTIYRIVLQNMHDLNVKLTPEQVAEFSEAMVWLRENSNVMTPAELRQLQESGKVG